VLIPSPRHRNEDLLFWRDYEEADLVAPLPDANVAIDAIRRFAAAGPCYCGVSWGKDSVVAAHLCREADPAIPLVHLRPTNHNPDCDAVRDAYLRDFPGQPYREIGVTYGNLHAQNLPTHELDRATDSLWYAAIHTVEREISKRHILGIRAAESAGRRIRCLRWGISSPNGCAPVAWWSTQAVFSYLAKNELPVHPAYAMFGGGRWERDRIRVAEIGDTRGTEFGRAEWEREYFSDILNRTLKGPAT